MFFIIVTRTGAEVCYWIALHTVDVLLFMCCWCCQLKHNIHTHWTGWDVFTFSVSNQSLE